MKYICVKFGASAAKHKKLMTESKKSHVFSSFLSENAPERGVDLKEHPKIHKIALVW